LDIELQGKLQGMPRHNAPSKAAPAEQRKQAQLDEEHAEAGKY
jgi:hypothetical protein